MRTRIQGEERADQQGGSCEAVQPGSCKAEVTCLCTTCCESAAQPDQSLKRAARLPPDTSAKNSNMADIVGIAGLTIAIVDQLLKLGERTVELISNFRDFDAVSNQLRIRIACLA